MPARSIGSATVSFGLVSIPVRLYVATHSEQPSFNLIHGVCKSRIKQQTWCPRCERVVERSELVKGREVAKDQYVLFTDEELKALEAAASQAIDIQEFVPLADVDPVYFQDTHYLGPGQGRRQGVPAPRRGDARHRHGGAGAARVARQGAAGADPTVRRRARRCTRSTTPTRCAPSTTIERGPKATVKPAETTLARKLIEQLAADRFAPEQYHDHWRERLQEAVDQKVAGEEVAIAGGASRPAPR